jgi:pimeloyl-ACP methyl ester carboxylesterase
LDRPPAARAVRRRTPDQYNIVTGDILTNYLEEGTGSPVVLLHGSEVGVSAFANWNKTLPEIGRHFRAIAVDVAGFGYSKPPVNAIYGSDYWVKHVVSFPDALKIDRTNIIGNSFGARSRWRLHHDIPNALPRYATGLTRDRVHRTARVRLAMERRTHARYDARCAAEFYFRSRSHF